MANFTLKKLPQGQYPTTRGIYLYKNTRGYLDIKEFLLTWEVWIKEDTGLINKIKSMYSFYEWWEMSVDETNPDPHVIESLLPIKPGTYIFQVDFGGWGIGEFTQEDVDNLYKPSQVSRQPIQARTLVMDQWQWWEVRRLP